MPRHARGLSCQSSGQKKDMPGAIDREKSLLLVLFPLGGLLRGELLEQCLS